MMQSTTMQQSHMYGKDLPHQLGSCFSQEPGGLGKADHLLRSIQQKQCRNRSRHRCIRKAAAAIAACSRALGQAHGPLWGALQCSVGAGTSPSVVRRRPLLTIPGPWACLGGALR